MRFSYSSRSRLLRCAGQLGAESNERPNRPSYHPRASNRLATSPHRIECYWFCSVSGELQAIMKKILCGFAVLLLVVSVWAGSAADGIVARIAFVSDTHVNLRTNEPGLSYNRRVDQAVLLITMAMTRVQQNAILILVVSPQ